MASKLNKATQVRDEVRVTSVICRRDVMQLRADEASVCDGSVKSNYRSRRSGLQDKAVQTVASLSEKTRAMAAGCKQRIDHGSLPTSQHTKSMPALAGRPTNKEDCRRSQRNGTQQHGSESGLVRGGSAELSSCRSRHEPTANGIIVLNASQSSDIQHEMDRNCDRATVTKRSHYSAPANCLLDCDVIIDDVRDCACVACSHGWQRRVLHDIPESESSASDESTSSDASVVDSDVTCS